MCLVEIFQEGQAKYHRPQCQPTIPRKTTSPPHLGTSNKPFCPPQIPPGTSLPEMLISYKFLRSPSLPFPHTTYLTNFFPQPQQPSVQGGRRVSHPPVPSPWPRPHLLASHLQPRAADSTVQQRCCEIRLYLSPRAAACARS